MTPARYQEIRATIVAAGYADEIEWAQTVQPPAQLVEVEDRFAEERVRRAVEEIVAGKLSPDTDFQWQWVARFGNSMMEDRPGRRPPTVRGGK